MKIHASMKKQKMFTLPSRYNNIVQQMSVGEVYQIKYCHLNKYKYIYNGIKLQVYFNVKGTEGPSII